MKILVVCQHYYPEPFRVTDLCETLASQGHEVDVVCGVPNYPLGVIYDGYRHGKKREEVLNGVHIKRTFTIGRRTGAFFRLLNYYSFAFSSTRYTAKLKKEYDVVFVNQLSPVMMACAGVKYAKKHDTKLVYYCMDLWPESLAAGGIRRGSFIYRVFDRISAKLYGRADKILVTSKNFVPYFKEHFGVDEKKLSYLPQYAEDCFEPQPIPQKDTIDFTFAGNVGAAQSVETIIRAAAELKEISCLRFHIVGDGTSLEACKQLAAELQTGNVIFHGRKPVEEMPAFYANSDAMLVTLCADPFLSLTLPGKVQTYMAAGKPIIASANGETAQIIKEAECGLCSSAEDSHALAENVKAFLQSNRSAYAKNSSRFYEEQFRKEIFINRLSDELKS